MLSFSSSQSRKNSMVHPSFRCEHRVFKTANHTTCIQYTFTIIAFWRFFHSSIYFSIYHLLSSVSRVYAMVSLESHQWTGLRYILAHYTNDGLLHEVCILFSLYWTDSRKQKYGLNHLHSISVSCKKGYVFFWRKFHVQTKWIEMTKENIHFSTSRNTESLYYPFMYDWNSTNLKKKIQSRFCTALHPLLLPRHPRKMIIIFQRNSITELSSCHQLYVKPV